jgi:hypothetical protein
LVKAYGAINKEQDASGILTNGLGLIAGQRDILIDYFHRAFCYRALFLLFQRRENGAMDIVRDFGRGTPDEFEQRIQQQVH